VPSAHEAGTASLGAGLLDPADGSPEGRARLALWLRVQAELHLEPELGAELLARAGGDPRAALAALEARAQRRGGSRVRARREEPARAREALAGVPAWVLPLPAEGYPARLRAIPDPPAVLCVQGRAESLVLGGVAIVGARAATRYGLEVARDLAAQLARRGVTVVSGLARGIDAAAHRGALEAGGATVAVLACGLDRTYPPEHAALRGQIAATGAVVSEMPPGVPPRAPYFPLRNRLISGLVDAVVVVEARTRSGSLITARHALTQGREVMAVPGPIRTPTSAGPNRLLADGAPPLLCVDDVLERLPPGAATRAGVRSGAGRGSDASRPRAELPPLLALLARGPLDRDAAAAALGWPPGRLAAELVGLALAGHVVEDRDGRLHARLPSEARSRGGG
jgi:DNA processing protein